MNPSRLIIMSGGSRHGGDETSGEFIPDGTAIGSSSQEGFSTLEYQLQRRLSTKAIERMYGPIRAVDEQGETVWQGELRRPDAAAVKGNHQTISPSALGLSCLREDRADVLWLGIDRDLSRWGQMSLDRRGALIASPFEPRDGGGQEGRLVFDGSGVWNTGAGRPFSAVHYKAAPLNIGRVLWASGKGRNINTGWDIQITPYGVGPASIWPSSAGVGTVPGMISIEPGRDVTFPAGASVAELGMYHVAGAIAAEATRSLELADVVVLGDHGLPLIGTGAADYGLRPSDIVRRLIARYGEGLRPGYIPESPIAVPHSVALEATTIGTIANDLNGFLFNSSCVWEKGRWDFAPFGEAPSSRTWKVSIDDEGVDLTPTGDDGSAMWTGVVVSYRAPDGERLSVGPPGSVAHSYDDRLQIESAGKTRIKAYDLGVIASAEAAAFAGRVHLADVNQRRRSGTATVSYRVTDAITGEMVPAYWIRGNDHLIVTGVGDDEPHRILEVRWQDGVASLTLDDQNQSADQFLSMLNAQFVGR